MGDPCYSVSSPLVLQSGSMLPGSFSFQMFLSLILILGAAFVALICDHLKRNNEQLRELAIELNVRRQEEYKRFRLVVEQAPKAIEAAAAPRAGAARMQPAIRMRVSPPKTPAADVGLPAGFPVGFHDGQVLTRLVKQRHPVSGLVVSIGVSGDGSATGNVPLLIQSLIGPNDFAAQSGEEEFLLIFPAERGVSAQRRLREVAQELWDFQLNSRETCSILFSWGGVEVSGESIDDAIESANERMEETRRKRAAGEVELSRQDARIAKI